MKGRYSTLDEFWPFYLSQHLRPGTRKLHFAGTTAALVLLAASAILRDARLALAAPVAAYGLAWVGHFFVERNKPATFRYPLLSLRADFRLYALAWTGGADAEYKRLAAEIRAARG